MLRRMSCVALLTILVVAAGVGRADASYTEYDSLTYAYVGGRPLHVALFIPMSASAANPVPCLVWVHGGGWEGGAYLPVPSFIMPLVTEKGIAIASVQYRLTSQEGYFA